VPAECAGGLPHVRALAKGRLRDRCGDAKEDDDEDVGENDDREHCLDERSVRLDLVADGDDDRWRLGRESDAERHRDADELSGFEAAHEGEQRLAKEDERDEQDGRANDREQHDPSDRLEQRFDGRDVHLEAGRQREQRDGHALEGVEILQHPDRDDVECVGPEDDTGREVARQLRQTEHLKDAARKEAGQEQDTRGERGRRSARRVRGEVADR